MLPADLNFPPKPSSGGGPGAAGLRSSPPAGALPVPCPVGPPPPPPGPPPLQPRPPSGPAADSPPPLSVVGDLNYRPKSNSGSSLAQSPPVTPSSSHAANASGAAAKEASVSGDGASAAGSDSPTHSQVRSTEIKAVNAV